MDDSVQNQTLKPGDPIPSDATGSLNQNQVNTQLKPGDPIPSDATGSQNFDSNFDSRHPSTLKSDLIDTATEPIRLAKGVVKGIGQTVSTVGNIGSNALRVGVPGVISGLGPNPISDKIDQGLKSLDQATTPKDTAEKAGMVLEGVGEFVLGDEALKGLNIAERLGIAQRIADIGQKYPPIAKILGRGVQAIRQGIVGGGQQLLHGATPGEALKTGAEGAGIGVGTGVLTDLASEGVGRVADIVKKTTGAAARTTQELQPEYQQGIKDLVDQVAKEEGVPTAKSASIKDYVGDTAQNVEDSAVKKLQEIDKAAGEPFVQKFRERVANINRKLNSLAEAPGGPEEAKLELERTQAIEAMEDAFKEAEKTKVEGNVVQIIRPGVPRQQLDEGLQQFKKAQALFDLDRELKRPNMVTGMRANEATAKQLAENPEFVDPEKFNTRVNQMYDNGRLQEALGNNRSGNMLRHLNDSLNEHHQLETEARIARGRISTAKELGKAAAKTAIGAGIVGAGAGAYKLVKGSE